MQPNEPIQPPPGFSAPPPFAPAPGAGPARNPWEDRRETGTARALWDTLVMSLSRPGDLFCGTPRAGGLGGPLAYAVILGTLGMVASSIWQALFRALGLALSSRCGTESASCTAASGIAAFAMPLVLLVLGPVLITIALFIGAGLTHLGLMILGADRHGFEGTFRGLAYAQGPIVFEVIPFVGGIIGGIWALVLQVIGISKLQETEWWRALIAILLFPCACALIGLIAAVAIAVFIASRAGA